MKWSRFFSPVFRTLFIIGMPLFIFAFVVAIAFNCVPLYEYGFEKYDASERLGVSEADLTKVATDLIAYYISGDEFLDTRLEIAGQVQDLYNREELIHMKDVKGLVRLDYGLLLVTTVYLATYIVVSVWRKTDRRQLLRSVLFGGGLTLVIMIALYLGSLWDFDQLFYRFHLLAFSNDFWSAKGYMLKLFPGGFWYDITLYCALAMAGIAAVTAGVSGGWLYSTGKGLHFRRLMS